MHTSGDSPLILGCMNLGGDWDPNRPLRSEAVKNAIACVKEAMEAGIRTFDHADIYCRGKSEEAFGHVWKELGIRREDLFLQSKCGIRFDGDPDPSAPHRYDFSAEHITTSVSRSLERLRTDRLDLLLLHRPDPLFEPDEVGRAFEELKRQNLVAAFGVSNFSASLMALLQSSGNIPLVANQLALNLLHLDLIDETVTFNNASQRGTYLGEGTLEYCRMNGIQVQAYSPLAKGKLTPVAHDADERTRQAGAAVASPLTPFSLAREATAAPACLVRSSASCATGVSFPFARGE